MLGNHEHYHGLFYDTTDVLRENLPFVTILDNQVTQLGDYVAVGTTLWTDFDRDPIKALTVQWGLNDYRIVKGKDYRKLTTDETAAYHERAKQLIRETCSKHDKVLVFGHHGPSYRSVAARFQDGGSHAGLNPGYMSHLDEFVFDYPQIKLWTHGHTHDSFDYRIGDTRVVCNPRGYQRLGGEPENRRFNPNLILEIE